MSATETSLDDIKDLLSKQGHESNERLGRVESTMQHLGTEVMSQGRRIETIERARQHDDRRFTDLEQGMAVQYGGVRADLAALTNTVNTNNAAHMHSIAGIATETASQSKILTELQLARAADSAVAKERKDVDEHRHRTAESKRNYTLAMLGLMLAVLSAMAGGFAWFVNHYEARRLDAPPAVTSVAH